MTRKLRLLWMVLLLLLLAQPIARAEGPVRAVMFWSPTCPQCHQVMDDVLPVLQTQYGDQLDILLVEVAGPETYEIYLNALSVYNVPPQRQGVPALYIGDHHLVGPVEISQLLPGLIDEYLAAGGIGLPAVPGLDTIASPAPTATPSPLPTRTPTPRPTATVKACVACEDLVIPEGSPTPQPVVHFWLFYDSHCPPCQELMTEILPPILGQYAPGQVVVHQRDLEKDGYDLMQALAQQSGLDYADIPVVFIADQALQGNAEIAERLPGLIDVYLAQGGVEPSQATPQPTREPTAVPDDDPLPIHLAYFYQAGCQDCDRVQLDLNYLQYRYPELVVHSFDVQEDAALAEWLGERAGVPEVKRLVAPAVFVGQEALVGDDLHARTLEELIGRYATSGADPAWQGWEEAAGQAADSIIARFRSFGLLTVLAAGLIDGLNPCAFATIVFFLSYLAFMERKGREVLAVGAAFTLGVFLTYLGVGFGFLRFLASLPFLTQLSKWLYGLTAALCLVLAVGSLYDWWQARRGKPQEMRLKLPDSLRLRINRVIREGAQVRAFVAVAFVTGVVVSFIELACTGQVYLPTIVFVLGHPELQVRAGLYLLLYNLMFILPLVIVFVLGYLGTSSQQLGLFIHRRAGAIKLATAALFLLLAGWLLMTFF